MLQGFIFSGLLIGQRKQHPANLFLGLTVLFLSLYLVWVLKYDYGIQRKNPHLQFLPVIYLWGIGPSFYAYLRAYFGKPLSRRQTLWHFFPLLLEIIYFNGCTLIFFLHQWDRQTFSALERLLTHHVFCVEHIVGLLSMGIYLYKSYGWLLAQKNSAFFVRIRNLLLCFTLLWLVWIPYTIYDIVYFHFGFPPSEFYAFYLFFADRGEFCNTINNKNMKLHYCFKRDFI